MFRFRAIATLAIVAVAAAGLSGCGKVKEWGIEALAAYYVPKYLGDIPPYENDAQEVQTVKVAMRDGVKLETHIYLPEGKGPWPTIVVRDPYSYSKYLTCRLYVRYGYACVHQDVRGRFGSEGDWYPLVHERDDGVDTLNWVLAQPWQNRKLALVGASYVGLVQWAIADKLPPEVKTFIADVSHGDYYELAYHGGQFDQGITGAWLASLYPEGRDGKESALEWEKSVAGFMPANGVDPAKFGKAWPAYRDYIAHPEKGDPFWHQPIYDEIRDSYKGVAVPVMLTGRWYDFFLRGTLKMFPDLPTRAESLLVIEPGDHSGRTGDLEVPGKKRGFANTVVWLDHYLKGEPLPDELKPGYRYYVNGADRWEHADAWPTTQTVETLYLADLGKAKGKCDGGRLAAAEAETAPVSYVYDPKNPVRTRGGSFLLAPDVAPAANAEQGSDLCSRGDVLSFSSEAIPTAKLISGPITVKLRVSSSAPDTAFAVKLSEHFADGRVFNIRDDYMALAFRKGDDTRLTYTPGEEVELEFAMNPIAWQLQPGSKLRLDITSSNFPAFPVHSNKAGLWSAIATTGIATQTVHGGSVALAIEGTAAK